MANKQINFTEQVRKLFLITGVLIMTAACSGGSSSDGGTVTSTSSSIQGVLDSTFNGSGIYEDSSSASSPLSDNLLLLSDGTIGQVSFPQANSDTDLQTIRVNLADGTKNNASFGALGLTPCKSLESGTSACKFGVSLVQTDGKVIQSLARTNSSNVVSTVLIRFNRDGSIDTSFGVNGIAEYSASPAATAPARVLEQVDGKILVLTKMTWPSLIRFNSNGSLDTSFAVGGVATLGSAISSASWTAYAMDVDAATGNIYVGGSRNNSNYGSEAFALRVNSNGQLDTSYGNQGSAIAYFGGYDQIDVAFEASTGELFLSTHSQYDQSIVFTKLKANGNVDLSFGVNGEDGSPVNITNEIFAISRLHLGPDGLLYVLGYATGTAAATSRVVMFRLTSTGGFDQSFAANGIGGAGIFATDTTNALYQQLQMSDFGFTSDCRIAMGGTWATINYYGQSPIYSYYTAVIVID